MTKKPTVTTLASGFNSTETLNANFEALRDGFDNTLSLDGSTPNAMEADLDLNGNNIINASVIGTSSLVVNGKLISVSADPVFDGTVSVFGANLIADVDAAAVKTTLGLSTVASTGSYNDLSNQPSFASPAQGALADSALQVGDSLDAGNLVNALPAIDGSALTGLPSVPTIVRSSAFSAPNTYRYSFLHGQGSVPDLVWAELKVLTAQYGYGVGTSIKVNNTLEIDEDNFIITLSGSSTELNLSANNVNILRYVPRKDINSTALVSFTAADVELYLVGVWF
jgi:hypothetical protein